jgi:hypothetical protein
MESIAMHVKSMYIISTMGRIPVSAAPTPGAGDYRLADGRVAHPLRAEFAVQAFCGGKCAAVDTDILAHQEDQRVAPHFLSNGLGHCLAIGKRSLAHLDTCRVDIVE